MYLRLTNRSIGETHCRDPLALSPSAGSVPLAQPAARLQPRPRCDRLGLTNAPDNLPRHAARPSPLGSGRCISGLNGPSTLEARAYPWPLGGDGVRCLCLDPCSWGLPNPGPASDVAGEPASAAKTP